MVTNQIVDFNMEIEWMDNAMNNLTWMMDKFEEFIEASAYK